MKAVLIKSLGLLIFFSSLYAFFLYQQSAGKREVRQKEERLQIHRANLVQNRLAFVEFTKLNPNAPNFDSQAGQIFDQLSASNKKGREDLEKFTLEDEKLTPLLDKVGDFYEEEKMLTYPFDREKVIELITHQTNLILELDFQIQKLEK